METNTVNRKAFGLLILVLVLGIALGAVGTRLIGARAFADRANPRGIGADRQHAVSRLTEELSLTPDQEKRVSEILSDMQTKYNNIRQQANPQYEQVRNEGHDQIRQILTPEQRAKFEVFLKRLDEERRNRESQNH